MDRDVLRKIYRYLDKIKFFGLRKVYFLAKDLHLFFKNIVSPKLVNSFLSKRIIEHFSGDSGHNLDSKKEFLGFGLIHYCLVRNIRPKRVLCVGSKQGFIPAVLGLACKDNGMSRVDFVDAGYDSDHTKSWAGVGFWKKVDPKRHFGFLGLDRWLTVYIMSSERFVQRFPKRKYDYIYIDGDHSYEGVRKDYNLFWQRLEKGGLMVFHDVVVKKWGGLKNFGVWRLWRELPNKNKITFPFPKESGLGILQK